MQGVILSAGTAQGIILGDDGVRYTFTPLGWRHDTIRPEAGMRVDFEARGSHAVGIYPVPGAASTPPARPPTAPQPAAGGYPGQPTQPPYTPPTRGSFPAAQPSPTPQVATGGLPPQPPPVPPAGSGGGMKWLWALAGAGAIVVLGIIGAFALGIFPARPPAEVTQLPVEAPSPASPPQVITPIAETLTPPPTTPIGTGATGRIAFHSDRDGDREIYVMNADGSDVNKLTDNSAWDSTPAWSPDGQRIAFVSGRDGNIEIYVMNADGSDVTRLTDNSANDEEPSWSPDGQRIAFVSGRDGNAEIYVMNANGSDATRLTDNSAADLWPSWSPDGRRIAFTSGRDGNIEIYVMNADGSDATRLTDNSANDEKPSWSPDGQRIAFVSGRDGNAEIYVMNADGSDATRLTDNSANDEKPSWSPDGQRIAFVSGRDGNAEIYVMNADGSDATRLTDNSAYDELPAWSTSVASVATSTVPPTPTPIPIKEVNFAGLITSTNLPSQIQVVFSLRDQRGHAIVLPAEEIERETKVFERGRATDNNWEEIDYTETSFFVHTAENIDLEMVFALDFTNSMSKTRLPNGDSGIQAMLSAFDSALAVLPSAHRIGVVEFHDRNSEPGILSALTTDRAAIRESVSRFANSAFDPGSSRVWDSIVAGSELFSTIQENPRAVRVLVFLSDGRDTSSASDRDAARRFAQARKVQLYALGVGDVFQDVQLRKMAKDTDGRYYDVSDISLLQEQLQLLVNDLRGQYQLSYITLRRSGDYKIRMEVEVANIPGSTDVGPFNVASFFGPDNQGVIHFDPPSLDRANNRSTLFMRALHIPRNIDRIRFKLDTSNPVHVEPVSRRNGGLLDGWTLTGPDSTGFYEASSSQPIEFGNFGPMFKLTISGVTEQTPPDIPFEFDNSIYTDGKSLSHPPHVSVAPPPISSP